MGDKTCNKSFASDYLLLSPSDVTFFGLIKLLLSKHIGKRDFIDCPDGIEEPSFWRRVVIFISIVAQKVLKFISGPLDWFGSTLEFWLNFWAYNGGFIKFTWNFLRGKLIIPNKESANFLSTIALSDRRIELDRDIKRSDPRYTSHLSIMAAKVAYENQAYIKRTVENYWKMEFLGYFNCWNDYEEDFTTQAYMFSDKTEESELIVVAFRGTSPFNANDWASDVDLSWYHLRGIGKVHAGFLKALGLQKSKGWPKEIDPDTKRPYAYYAIRKVLRDRLNKNSKAKFIVTGHSLGGALTIVFPAVLAYHQEVSIIERLEGVYTFGQPRVGDDMFGQFMKEVLVNHGMRYHRFVYCNDLVPRVPFDDSNLLFKHFGTCFYYNSFYRGQVLDEEPNKNYFSLFAVIPMFLNAVWELIRSFFIHYIDGPAYKEGFVLRGIRAFGLLIAGIPAHCPQDYVNLTRLGSPEHFAATFAERLANHKLSLDMN